VPLPQVTQRRPLLLLSDDEKLGWKLLSVLSKAGRRLVRAHPAVDGRQITRIVWPEAVLLDMDYSEDAAWANVERLLQDENCPPLILLTSRGDRCEFHGASRAGFLADKNEEPSKLLEMIELKLESRGAVRREENAIQRRAVRWLKPCSGAINPPQLNRFWGINE